MIFAWTVFLRKRCTVTDSICKIFANKLQGLRTSQCPRACTKIRRKGIFQVKKRVRNSTDGQRRDARSETKNDYNSVPAMFSVFRRWISVLQMRSRLEAGSSDYFENSTEIYDVPWIILRSCVQQNKRQERVLKSTGL